MVVVMKERATEAQVDAVIARLIELGMDVHRSSGATRTDRKSTRLNSSHIQKSRMPSSA